MNDFSFSENSLAGVPAEGLREEAFSPRLQLEDAGRVTGLEPYGEISHQSFKTMDMVEPPPPVGSGLDFKEALAVYDTLEDGPARVALSNELDKWERRQALENYSSPLGERERREYQQKVERLDALGMDWKAHPEARKKVAEAYGEEWVRAFEAVPDEHKSRVRGEKVLEEFYSRPGDRDGDSMIRYLSSVDAPEGIRGCRDVWDRWNAGRQPFFKAQEKEAEAGRSFAAKAVPVIRAMMNGEGFLEALGKVELTPEEENFAMLHCGYGTPWGQAVQHAADWLRGRGFDLQPEAAVERRAKELADAYVKERERYVSRNDASLSWGGLPNPFSRTMDDFRQEARDEMTGNITDANVFDFARALLDLKTEDPMAAEAVIGLYKADAERLRNDSTLFVSPFNRTMRMMMESSSSLFEQLLLGDVREGDAVEWQPTGESFAPVVRDSEGKQVYRVLTPDQNEMISQIRAMKAEIAESPDGAWWIRRQFDGLGRMAAQTSFFLATRGMGTFASVANDRMEELRAQGVSPLESLIRGGIAGGTEVLVERLGGESLFKTLRFLGRKMPFAGKFAGYMGSAADMMKRGLYGNAALRYGVASLAAGGSEWMEEFIQPTLQAPLDAGLARLFGSGNGMTVEDWKEMLRGAADPDLGFQMLMFGAVVGGAQIPAFAREARVSRVGAPQIEGLGVGRAEAERIASIVDPVEKSREIFQAALSMSDRAAQLESVRQGFSAMKEDFSWLARQEAYQAEVELLNLPRVEDLGDGSWRFTTTVRDAEGQESYDVLELSEQDATARMQALLHDGIRLRMLEAQQAFAVDRTIDQLSQSGKYVFEDMGRAETVETARKLAEAARLRIAEGADVNAEAQDLGTRMTYGQAAGMGSSFEERVKLGVARGEVSASRRVHSNAYRVAMRNGQTLIRFHKGEVTVPELLEEVLETHLTEDMENTKHSLDWYANNLRALQDALRKEGYLSKGKDLIRKDGEVSVKDVVEGMSMLAKGDVLARAADMRLPQWMKDFLQMVRQWVSSAKALLDLGTGLHEMERRRLAGESVPIDADFAQMVHALSNSLESYWMQEGARQGEADVQRIVEEVGGSGVSMSLAEDSSVSFSLVSIPSGEVITTAAEMRARLKPLQGKVFVNKNTGIQAVIEARVSGKTVGKAQQAQMSVANLKAVGFSAEEARKIHYTAATRIHELFENAEDGRFEEEYKDDPSRAGAYHFFNTVEIEGIGSFDVNVTALALKNEDQKLLYTLELTIENPKGVSVAYPNPDIQGDAYSASGVSTRNLSSYRSFVEKEKAAVRKKAVADGTFMKAPNGKETNLTEDQWLAVRTAAFKNWFGDWEHDPQNASKVVDENGEPRVVYHGSHQWFTSFNDGKQRQQSGAPAGTIFANDNREIAVSFADYYGGHADEVILDPNDERHPRYSWGIYREGGIYDLFMNIRNPLVVDFEGRPWLDSSKGGDINALCSKAKESGHDGVIALNIVDAGLNDQENVPASTDYVAFDSVQVKSATQNRGTYDPKNPDITFSVIGPNAATWGKYADKAFAGRDDGKLRAEIDASQASLKAPENFPFLSMFDEWSRGMGYRKNPVWRGLLEDVLNFDELYEAYPSLRKMYVFAYKNKKDSARGYYDSEERSITINLAHIGPIGAQLSTLLHEIQHAIQDIEGFARGSNLEEGRSLDDYMRSAGEIESRNVEKRILWDGERRESKPFNDTLEFPGEAIVSFSIASAQEQGLFHDGHFEAGNAVITEPGVTFSITALHASPHSFRKFDTAFMGKGEGAQAYGWGLYFAENPEVNRSYLNQFAQDKATWKFREVETAAIEEMQRALVGSFLPKDALPEAKEDASDIAWSVLGDLVDAARGSMTVLDVVMELHDEIDTNRKYAETYPQVREKLEQLEGFMLSLLDHLDEIEIRTGMPSNYKVELNVEDSELLGWDYVDETVLALLKDSPVEEVRYALERAERRADYRGENVSGKDVYQELFDAFWDGEDGTKQEAQKAASVSLLSSDIKGIRYADGYTRGKVEEEQTYNYVIFDGNDIKITAFADESTGGAWADYEDPTASFSLATRESVWVTLEREAQKNRLEVLRSQTAKALETWRRVCAANDVKQGDGAEAFGRVMAVVASIYKTLPEGYRFGLYPYMRAAENLATRLEDGQAWLSDELKKETLMDDTSERMDAVIDKLLARTLEQADRYAVDQMRAEMVARIKAVQPTKKASGKFNKGKLSAEDYRHLHGIVAMMNTDQEAKEKRMLELEGVLSSNQSTEEERGAAELELKDWHTFGYLAGMGLEQTRACARALALFITTGRTAWSTRLDEERRRTKFKAEKIVEGLGQATPQGGRDAEEDAKASTRTKAAKYLKYGLQSYSQLLNGWKKIPALRGLAHAEVTAIAEANVALRNMKHARDREVTALVKRCFGVQRTKDVARVLSDFKKTGDSGVVLNPLVKVERTVRIAEAREWVGLSFEEREERRKAIRKEYNDRGLSDDKASVPEALIPEMRRQLAELDELVKAGDGRARRRKNITAKEEVVRPGRKGETLKVSRAQAMYAILLYEQAEYVETMRNEGIGEAEVARLREFVGAEGLAFGYGLRELMNRQGKLLARVYEEREGVPFPAVENYFRAVFRADHKLDTKASFGEQTNAVAGGAKYGMLIPRRKHNLHLAWNMDCEAVFQAASAEVENYICTADITARWRGILADKEAAASLKEHMGRHGIDSLRHWLDVIDGAGVMEGGALLAGAQATSRFQSAKAVALLAWNVLTMLKQTSGLMHGMFAGEVGMGSFLLHLGQTMSMTGRMGVFEVMKTEAFRARTNDAQAELVSQLMGYASDQNYTGAIRFSMAGMRAIEKMDVWSNAVSMAALYNAKWAELEEAGKRTGVPMTDDEMHALCMQSVTRALELVAQPLTQSQKSMLGASTGLFAKMACFMSSEVLNKVGMIVSHVSSGNWGQALALYGMMSVAEQTVIALWHALLDDEDEWEKNGGWFGAMLGAPVAMIGGVPMLGAAVEFGYKQATGQRIYAGTASGVIDYSAIYRAAKNTWKAVTGEKEMTFADWAELILLDAKAAAYVAGAGAGSRSKAADSVASWLLSVAGVANLSKPGFKLAE